MKLSQQITSAYRSGGARNLFRRAIGYIDTRARLKLLGTAPRFFGKLKNDSAVKILARQAGDEQAIEMLRWLVSDLNSLNPDAQLTIAVPNYFKRVFAMARPLLLNGRLKLSPIGEYSPQVSLMIVNRAMLNQLSPQYADRIAQMHVPFANSAYIAIADRSLHLTTVPNSESPKQLAELVANNKPPGEVVIVNKYGFQFAVRTGTMDEGIVDEVRSEYLDKLSGIGFQGTTVLDLGGHIGSFSIQISALLKQPMQIIVVEPAPRNAELIRKNIELNQLHSSIELKEMAVSSQSGVGTLFISSDNTGGNKLNMAEHSATETVEVPVTDFPTLLEGFSSEVLDLLKIDVEGSEHAILFPHGRLLSQRVRLIVGEAGGSDRGDGLAFLRFLEQNGFAVSHQGNESQLIFLAVNKHLN
ncbi:FkbM family methyltransferase [Paraburkholderia sp. MMS20-SJTN17]|uniref:FkbM family methyltransferase n=1 Tax=Paraburkholderia translucens TaxID=2886945 RepID=A0ABS8KDA7_9BURK|nr:FkbM family methyltransferase [Paraburkholderia sp. MMS20-SJTN17]MCC8402434.1 FkbM family methyltransferase [Paraburkholderia sp. MMS20-SJTN17]